MSFQIMTPFQKRLVGRMKEYTHFSYMLGRQFPKDETYGARSQLNRAAMSILLNYIEGFTRRRSKVLVSFYEIAYGSLHETRILLEFATEESWISSEHFKKASSIADEIGAMLYSEIKSAEKRSQKNH